MIDVLHELSVLQIAADIGALDISDRVAVLRRALMTEVVAERIRQRFVIVPHHSPAPRADVLICDRLVRLPDSLIRLAQILESLNETPVHGPELARRAWGRCSSRGQISSRVQHLKDVLAGQDCGLWIHSGPDGYALIAEPVTVAQRLGVAS